MISRCNLQDEAMARQQAKIELMRNANEERRLRFLDAPGRTMGINSQALGAQVALHQRNKEEAKESDRIDKLRSIEITNILESSIQEEKYQRKERMEDVKRSWNKSSMDKANMQVESLAIDPERCSVSSAQFFSGEDARKAESDYLKQQEMRRWVTEKMYHDEYKRVIQEVENKDHASMLHSLDATLGAAETEEAHIRKFINHAVQDDNAALAEEHRYRYRKVVTPVDMPTSLDLFDEDVHKAMDENGHIVRKDMFKGFTPAQKLQIKQENEILLLQKREKEEVDRLEEELYSRQQSMVRRALEHAHYNDKMSKDAEMVHHLSVLKQQAYDVAVERERSRRLQREPAQQRGFYDGFGKSCR